MIRALIPAVILLVAPLAHADQDGIMVVFDAKNPAQVADGYFLYQDHCAACHGENLEGQEGWENAKLDGVDLAPPHDDSGHTWHHADDELFEMTKYGFDRLMKWEDGTSAMIGYADVLSDTEIVSILAFIKSTWSPRSLEWQTMVNRSFEQGWEPFSGLE